MSNIFSGTKPQPSQVINTTPNAYQGLTGPLGSALQNQLQNPNQYGGQYTAGLTGGEQTGLGGVQGAAGQVGQQGAGYGALLGQAGFQMNPFAGLSGLGQYGLNQVSQQAYGQGPLAGLAQTALGQQLGGQMNPYAGAIGPSQGEMAGLQQIGQTAFGQNPLQGSVNDQLMRLISGGGAGSQFTSPVGQFQSSPLASSQLINGNPLVQQLIDAAQRPILNNFSDQALQQRGLYTGAGQQIQGQGSSPFAMASARLAEGAQGALNDASLGVTNQALQQQLQAVGLQNQGQLQQEQNQLQSLGLQQQGQLQALGLQQGNQFQGLNLAQQQPGLQLQQQLAGLNALGLPRTIAQQGLESQAGAFGQAQQNQLASAGLSDTMSNNALQRALAGFQASQVPQQNQSAAFENAANRQLQAGSALNAQDLAGQQAQLQAQLQNLQAQGLPRLVQQYGIDAGLQQYNQQQAQLMQLMQLIGGVSQPSTAILPGQAGTPGLVQSFVGGLGGGIGSKISDRRLKKDVQHAGQTSGGLNLYRFRYKWQDDNEPLQLGVMADEIETIIPDAVLTLSGIKHVDYTKVFAHG